MRRTGMTLTGDWRKINPMMRKMKVAPEYFHNLIYDYAVKLQQELISSIKNYSDGPENAPATVKRKGFNKPWTESGKFGSTEGITIETTDMGKKFIHVVGPDPDATEERTGEPLWKVLAWMEDGTEKMPSRPLFAQAYDKAASELPSWLIFRARDYWGG